MHERIDEYAQTLPPRPPPLYPSPAYFQPPPHLLASHLDRLDPHRVGCSIGPLLRRSDVLPRRPQWVFGLASEIPEDLYHLIKKAVSIRKHLERKRKDKDSKFHLILVKSRIHRLAHYYKKTKKLPQCGNSKFKSTTASTLVA
ncbi:hypothetical protein UlMin_012436 [Ulmus minor]